jgi:hypothetical protein
MDFKWARDGGRCEFDSLWIALRNVNRSVVVSSRPFAFEVRLQLVNWGHPTMLFRVTTNIRKQTILKLRLRALHSYLTPALLFFFERIHTKMPPTADKQTVIHSPFVKVLMPVEVRNATDPKSSTIPPS